MYCIDTGFVKYSTNFTHSADSKRSTYDMLARMCVSDLIPLP